MGPSTGNNAIRPVCEKEFGSFDDENVNAESKCNPSVFAIPPETDDIQQCENSDNNNNDNENDDNDNNDNEETCKNVDEFEWREGKIKTCDSKWLKRRIKKKGLEKICNSKAKPSKKRIWEL